MAPRYFTAFAESAFPVDFFIDGRDNNGQLEMDVARSFFQNSRFPDGFFRPNHSVTGEGSDVVFAAHPIEPGRNVGGVNNYVLDPTSADFTTPCLLYTNFVNETIVGLYPTATGDLRTALNFYLNLFFEAFDSSEGSGCTQLFPYGQD